MATEGPTADPTSALGKVDLCDIPAVIRWDDEQQRGVGTSLTSTPVSLDVDFDPSNTTASFRLRIAFLQRGSDKTTPVFLLIDSRRIQSIFSTYGVDQTPDGATKPDYSTTCLRFLLSGSSTLIVPPEQLRLKDKSQLSVMRSVRWAARQSVLTVHIQDHVLSPQQLTALVEAPYHQFTSSLRHSDIGRLYGGRGGKVFEAGAEDSSTDHPPSYNEVPAPPPIAPSYGSDTATCSKKRRRVGSPAEDLNVSLVERLCKKIAQEQFEQTRVELSNMESRIIERLDQRMSDQVRALGESFEPRFEELEAKVREVRSELEAKTQELKNGTLELDDSCQAELQRLDECIQEVSDDIDHRVDFEIEDRVLGIKADMEEFVKDELANTADTLRQRISEASVYIEFKE